jgi:hypothetical protein
MDDSTKIHYNIKWNKLKDIRSVATWVATYKGLDDVRVFYGGTVPLTMPKDGDKVMKWFDENEALEYVEAQFDDLGDINMIYSDTSRIMCRHIQYHSEQ